MSENATRLASVTPNSRESLEPVPMPAALTLPAAEQSPLFLYWQLLRRQMWKLLAATILIEVVVAIIVLRIPKLYESVAVIRVDPSASQSLVQQNSTRATTDLDSLLATESSEIQSPSVILPVIRKLNLLNNPEINYTPPRHPQTLTVEGVPEPFLDAFSKNLSVSRPPVTMLLNVSFRSRSPQLSARVANAVADELLQHEYATRSEALRSSSQYLSLQVQQLRGQMEASQAALAKFEQQNNIISPTDNFNLMNQRLSTEAADLDKQEATLRQLQADLQLGEAGNLDALLVSDRGAALKPLMDALHAQQVSFAGVAATYGPGSPIYRDAQRKLQETQAAVGQEGQHITQQIRSAYDSQLQITRLTQQAFENETQRQQALNAKAAQYAILQQQAATQSKLYNDLLQQMEVADVTAGYHSDNLRIVGTAEPDPVPAYPRVGLILALAAFASMILGIAATLVWSGIDRTLSDPATVPATIGERLLGSLPYTKRESDITRLWRPDGPRRSSESAAEFGPFAEGVFSIRTTLMLSSAEPPRVIGVTSAMPRDGKTTTSISLAAASARIGSLTTLLIDADLRRPSVHRTLGLSNRIGLSSVLLRQASMQDAVRPSAIPGLSVLPAGPRFGASAELLANHLAAWLEEAKAVYDCIIIDCPPALGFADSLLIGPVCDAMVLVALAGRTQSEYVRDVAAQLRRVRANVAGIVLNGVSSNTNSYYTYMASYHRYYSSEDDVLPVGSSQGDE